MELIKDIPDNSVDMILADLPYGHSTTANKWDKQIDLNALFKEFRRIIKEEGCIALNGSFKFGVDLCNIAPDLYKYEWIWQKEQGTNCQHANHQPLRIHEYIFIFGKGHVAGNGKRTAMKYNPQMVEGTPYSFTNGFHRNNNLTSYKNRVDEQTEKIIKTKRFPTTIQEFTRDKGYHPTQKPVALLEYLIKTYTDPGDIVLDPVMGSGSTGVACINTGRQFIGIEINNKYFDIATERINRSIKENG